MGAGLWRDYSRPRMVVHNVHNDSAAALIPRKKPVRYSNVRRRNWNDVDCWDIGKGGSSWACHSTCPAALMATRIVLEYCVVCMQEAGCTLEEER